MRKQISLKFPVSCELESDPTTSFGLLVLHGFTDNAKAARKRLLGLDPIPGFTVLSPNGLFPTPVKKADGYHDAYAWYFRDLDSGREMVSPEFAAQGLLTLIQELGLQKLQWIILGFSQGGFLAPYLLNAGLNSTTIIGIGAAYRAEDYEGLSSVRVQAIHGIDDKIVPHNKSLESFETIQKMGLGIQFHSLPNLGHTLDNAGRALLQKIITEEKLKI